jgi:hypothetical protein
MIETVAWLGLFASIVLAVRGLVGRSMPLLGAASCTLFGAALLTGLASGYLWTIVLGVSAAATFGFMVLAAARHSWLAMWLAALASFVASILGMFSIGAFVFALTCVQLALVVTMRLGASLLGHVVALLVGLLAWVAVVPVQIWGPHWLWSFGIYQLVGLLGLLVVLAPIGRFRWRLS